jgi:hypothetical protein
MDLSKFHPTRRGFIRSVLLASGFAPGLLSLVARAGATAMVPIKAGVQEFVGDVRLNGRPVGVGQVVRPGDVCMTGAESSCVIVLGEHVYLLRETSEVEFYPELFEEAAADASLSGTIKMAAGAMLAVFGKTDTTIVTPMATIGIRGTACYTSIEPERTYACVCYGTADLASAVSGQALETVFSRHHDMPRYIYGPDSPVSIEQATVIDHSDAELRMLEALVNRIPPFDAPGAPPYTRYDPTFQP